nr:MAG TPA: hypothetical protein [Caudoviricetes sp.]
MYRKNELKRSIAWHSIKYVLTAIFMVLNLLGILHWYWVWIFLPIILSLGLKILILLILSFFVCVLPRLSERWTEE